MGGLSLQYTHSVLSFPSLKDRAFTLLLAVTHFCRYGNKVGMVRSKNVSTTHQAASVLCLPPVPCCHFLCCTIVPPLWTRNRSLGQTGHLEKVRGFTLLSFINLFTNYYCLYFYLIHFPLLFLFFL